MSEIGKLMMWFGLALAGLGAALWLVGPKLSWLGRLPGDFCIERPQFRFYFPLTTCIIVSVILTLLAWVSRR